MRAEGGALSRDLQSIQLDGVDGRPHSFASLMGKAGTVVVFMACGCPTARSYEQRLIDLQTAWRDAGIRVIAINSNNPYLSPPDSIAEMARRANSAPYNFPYLKDSDSSVAKRFGALCTPHCFLLDNNLSVVYSGRIDDSRQGKTITSRDLENAVSQLFAGDGVQVPSTEPFGCSIVW